MDFNTPLRTPKESSPVVPAKTTRLMLRLLRALQPISRIEMAERLGVNRSTITEICKPLITSGILKEEPILSDQKYRLQGRPRVGLSLADQNILLVGASIGVRTIQVGISDLSNRILVEKEFPTPSEPEEALALVKKSIKELQAKFPKYQMKIIGVSVPGITDSERQKLVYAPHLRWKEIDIAKALEFKDKNGGQIIPVIVENDATAAAIYEARTQLSKTSGGIMKDFVIIRSGTGIGVGLVLEGEVFRGAGTAKGHAGEFGHTTIVAGGKPCVCGNTGCWERYAAAAAAGPMYLEDFEGVQKTDKPPVLRFVEIVKKAEAGEEKAIQVLEKLGEYLGIGIANVFISIGIPRVIISGRLVNGWKFIEGSLLAAVKRSMANKIDGWTVERGEPTGAGIGGALEVAFEEYILRG